MDSVTFQYAPQSLAQLEAAALAAFEAGAPRVVLDLDSLKSLDSQATRGLILLLRRSREVGGEIVLRVGKPEIRRSLQVMALDRLFPLISTGVAA